MKDKQTPTVEQQAAIDSLPSLNIAGIARVIRKHWKPVGLYAAPYVDAMGSLDSIKDAYICDSGVEIVLRFLCNAATWRGDVARAVKAELNK